MKPGRPHKNWSNLTIRMVLAKFLKFCSAVSSSFRIATGRISAVATRFPCSDRSFYSISQTFLNRHTSIFGRRLPSRLAQKHERSRSICRASTTTAPNQSKNRIPWSFVCAGGGVLCFGAVSSQVTCAERDKSAIILENKIKERIARANLGHTPNILPWECISKDGRQIVKFQVLETSDLFFTLLSSALEMVPKSSEGSKNSERTSVNGNFSVWDSEKSTGIELTLKGSEDCRVRLCLPWADSTFPEVEITSGPSGFDDRQANFIGRLILNGNSSRAAPSSAGRICLDASLARG